jgi:DNA processing protein
MLERDDPRFPRQALLVKDAPQRLHLEGDIGLLRRPMVSIIGTRTPTAYGIKVAYQAAVESARAGLVVVSGLARGLDARAHQGALDAGGATIAVLGCGLAIDYPRANRRLRAAIRERGLLLTEFPPDQRPAPWTFPRRNRLIACLGRCLVVVEGRARGGTSNTVDWMIRLGRTVLAVPGRIDEPMSDGPNRMIQAGARPYLTPADILGEYGLAWAGSADSAPPRAEGTSPVDENLTQAEALLFDLVKPDPVHADELAVRSGLEPSLLLSALSSLELKGLVEQLPGKRFVLAA